MQRHFFAGAAHGELDKQGRLVIPATLLERAGHRPRGHGGRRLRPPGDLGSRHVAPAAARGRRERGRCCRASCQPRLIMSPSSPRRSSPLLDPRPGETIVDGTFGAGGHAGLLAERLRGDGKLIAIDRDPTVAPFFERFRRETRRQGAAASTASSRPCSSTSPRTASRPTSILLDLGVSSMQIDRPERGFSYAVDAPLDMRMDPSATYSARDVVNEADERELADIFKRYGEERYARQIARAIVRRRARAAVRAHGRSRRGDQGGDPRAGAVRRGPSGEARLPGASHRGQRRARRARARAAGGARDAAARRPARA